VDPYPEALTSLKIFDNEARSLWKGSACCLSTGGGTNVAECRTERVFHNYEIQLDDSVFLHPRVSYQRAHGDDTVLADV
jgi:hypothetical protein